MCSQKCLKVVSTHTIHLKKNTLILEEIMPLACVQGSTNGNNGVSISFKDLPMVPLFSSSGFPKYHIDPLKV